MSEIDPGPLSISKMKLPVATLDGSTMPSLPYWSGESRIYYLHSFIIYITHNMVIL